MTREEAAELLGVPVDADPVRVRRAWRTWARLAHPDAGGSPDHFRRLVHARDALLEGSFPEPSPMREPQPRVSWRAACARPGRGTIAVLAVGYVLALALAVTFAVAVLPVWMAALLMGVVSTSAAVLAVRWIATPAADVGHRISLLVAFWVPLATAQVVTASLLGVNLVSGLPALALPFAVAVALVNPGAGLWRPVPG